jgi:transposase
MAWKKTKLEGGLETMMYVGVDQHKLFSQVAVLDENGKVVEQRRLLHADREGMRKFFRSLGPCQGALEANRDWDWLHDMMEECLEDVKLSNPMLTRLIAESKVKTDKVDARTLAQLLRTGFLPEAYAPPMEIRRLRALHRYRMRLVQMQTRWKNRVHALLARSGIEHEESDLFGVRGQQWLQQLDLGKGYQRELEGTLGLLDGLGGEIKSLERVLRQQLRQDEMGKLIRTVPGIGVILGHVILMETGEIERFSSESKYTSYCGLTPSTRQSASRCHQGSVGKRGNHYLKWAFVEAAQQARRKDPALAALYARMKAQGKAKKGTVAVARHLARSVYYMMKRKEAYRYHKLNG